MNLALTAQGEDVKFLDRKVTQAKAIVPLHIARAPNALGRRLRLGPDPAAELDGCSHPGRFGAPDSQNAGYFRARAGSQPPERAISQRQNLGGHREGVLPTRSCSQENGQKLLRRQRGGPDRPETLARPVVFEVLGETQRHGQD